jgi:hypothetical protein
VIAAHFIEHLTDPARFIGWIADKIKPTGRIFLEWPHPFSKRMPTRDFFSERGITAFTTNFMDDSTHIEAWPVETIIKIANTKGLAVESLGRILFPEVAAQLRDKARDQNDIVAGTFSIWAAVGWAQYIVLSKPL